MTKKKKRRRLAILLIAALAIGVAVAIGLFWLTREKPHTVKVYFLKGDRLVAVERPLKPNESPLRKTVTELLSGPSAKEKEAGYSSLLPAGVKVLGIKAQDKTAIVDFNRRLEAYGGGTARLEGMIAQIVYTITDVPGIEKAWIWMEGEKEIVLGGEGLVLDHPLSRREVSY